jgi:hypothetical protein
MDLRRPLLLVALAMIVLGLLVELASPWVSGRAGVAADTLRTTALADLPGADSGSVQSAQEPPGRGITAMALLDGALAFRIALMVLALFVPPRLLGRVQGVATFLFSLLLLLAGIASLLFLLVELGVMVGLFLAPPFGTLAYLGIWGFFPRTDAAVLLGLLLFLKLAMVVFLVLAQPAFLKIKSLVAFVATSLLANLVLAFLHGLVPNPVTSIADEIGAIVVVVLGLIWLLLMLVGSVWGIVKALRVDRAMAR